MRKSNCWKRHGARQCIRDNSGAWSITSSTLGSGVHNISARASDVAGNLGPTSGTLAVTIGSTTFRVTAFSANASGVDFTFNRSPYLADINLYDGSDAAVDVPDVILHANTANVDIHGSLAFNSATNTMSFVKTGGILAPIIYTVTLRSSASGFHDLNGHLLDGNGNLIDTETKRQLRREFHDCRVNNSGAKREEFARAGSNGRRHACLAQLAISRHHR